MTHPNFYNDVKPITANIDQIIIISTILPKLSLNIIDHYLITYKTLQIKPIIILNKINLLNDENITFINEQINIYRNIDYRILIISNHTQNKLKPLKKTLTKHINIFTDQSNVDKSNLLNTLLKLQKKILTNDISNNSKLNQHTTTTTQLYHFPHNDDIINSPNIHKFNL